jgi:hypothetical protein
MGTRPTAVRELPLHSGKLYVLHLVTVNFRNQSNLLGAAVAQLVEALHYKLEGRVFDSQ